MHEICTFHKGGNQGPRGLCDLSSIIQLNSSVTGFQNVQFDIMPHALNCTSTPCWQSGPVLQGGETERSTVGWVSVLQIIPSHPGSSLCTFVQLMCLNVELRMYVSYVRHLCILYICPSLSVCTPCLSVHPFSPLSVLVPCPRPCLNGTS